MQFSLLFQVIIPTCFLFHTYRTHYCVSWLKTILIGLF